MACIRLMLRCLLIVTVALGLASAPLYAVAQATDGPAVAQPHHRHMIMVGQGSPDHDHTAPTHAMGQTCCHPGCIMAVVPGFADLAPVPLPWVTIPFPRDPEVTPIAPLGLDRPPKRA